MVPRRGQGVWAQEAHHTEDPLHTKEVLQSLHLLHREARIQDRVHRNEITYDKARQLTILTREPIRSTVRWIESEGYKSLEGSESAPRTDRWYPAIREIADNVNLRTEKEVARTARLVREGTTVKEAVHKIIGFGKIAKTDKGPGGHHRQGGRPQGEDGVRQGPGLVKPSNPW